MQLSEEVLQSLPCLSTQPFGYPLAPTLWEDCDETAIFIEDLPYGIVESTVADDRGFYFFDSDLFPALLYQQLAVAISGEVWSLWPVLELEYQEPSRQLQVYTPVSWQFQRRSRFWQIHFSIVFRFLHYVTNRVKTLYFICFTLTGMGFSCELISRKHLRLIISNTHDIILTAPGQVLFGFRSTKAGDHKNFICFAAEFSQVRQYAHHLRTLVRFNVYEYQGLLYTKEQKTKKITKQKQK